MKVGFVGLGTQGKFLAINLAAAGHDVIVHDVRPEPLNELAAAGARIAKSNREVGEYSEIVEICVLSDRQVEDVIAANDGILSGAKSGTIIAIHSTIDPAVITRLAELARPKQIELLDAPVSGGEAGAKRKSMSYMVGGSAAAFEKCRPLFETSGTKITHTGALGTGMRCKLVHQLIICINILAAYEGMKVGRAAGLPAKLLEQIVHEGGAQSMIADSWSQWKMAPHANSVFFKDLQLCLKLAHELNIAVPGAALTQQLLDTIVP